MCCELVLKIMYSMYTQFLALHGCSVLYSHHKFAEATMAYALTVD